MTPRQYKTRDGNTLWKFEIYLGRDPVNGKRKRKHVRGFTSKTEAMIAYYKMLEDKEKELYTATQFDKSHLTVKDVYNTWHEEYAPLLKIPLFLKLTHTTKTIY